mmetsp:Transcript_17386/g.66213  ORF Transcript_17386/g.66213 Transcript_17386/m.66213 type:complete len:205 (+) Transcript_17386:284-898(+)
MSMLSTLSTSMPSTSIPSSSSKLSLFEASSSRVASSSERATLAYEADFLRGHPHMLLRCLSIGCPPLRYPRVSGTTKIIHSAAKAAVRLRQTHATCRSKASVRAPATMGPSIEPTSERRRYTARNLGRYPSGAKSAPMVMTSPALRPLPSPMTPATTIKLQNPVAVCKRRTPSPRTILEGIPVNLRPNLSMMYPLTGKHTASQR